MVTWNIWATSLLPTFGSTVTRSTTTTAAKPRWSPTTSELLALGVDGTIADNSNDGHGDEIPDGSTGQRNRRLLSQRMMVMKDGQVIETGLTDRVLDDPQAPYTQLLVSSILQV